MGFGIAEPTVATENGVYYQMANKLSQSLCVERVSPSHALILKHIPALLDQSATLVAKTQALSTASD
jgi:hypothetical protein